MAATASATHQQRGEEDRGHGEVPLDTMELSKNQDTEEKSPATPNLVEQPHPVKDTNLVSENAVQDANNLDSSKDTSCTEGTLDGNEDRSAVDQNPVSAPQAEAFDRGNDNSTSEWDDYSRYINFESIETGSTGVYNENPSVMFHTGYGYSSQIPPYGPYSPVTTPLPPVSGDHQLYSQQFSFPGPYYQQTPPSMPYFTSPSPLPPSDMTMSVEHQGALFADNPNSSRVLFAQRADIPLPYSPFGPESFSGNSGSPGLINLQQGFDGFGSGGWSDWLKTPDGSSPAASPQSVNTFGSFGQAFGPISSGLASEQQISQHNSGSSPSSYERGYFHGGVYHHGSTFGGPMSGLGGRSFVAIAKERRRGKGNTPFCNCNGPLDFLNEQNRGPRATRAKNASIDNSLSTEEKTSESSNKPEHGMYNKADFPTDCKDAKFFIIKSYSEDNVHKSIKYGVWASTANGNKKLDSAYREAKEKEDTCPVFLFFSVNASAQFCGVAEMIGPVDFEKSVDYWQQDKWSGQFPVKWQIVKDIPNSLFRHIILENNDNKPVTNSRDTQEVKLDQGLEMLTIFKKYEAEMSILDDFDFYEEREKAMQKRKAHQQLLQSSTAQSVSSSLAIDWSQISAPKSGAVVNQIAKTFADVVRLEENKAAESQADKSSSSNVPCETAAHPESDVKAPAAGSEVSHRS